LKIFNAQYSDAAPLNGCNVIPSNPVIDNRYFFNF